MINEILVLSLITLWVKKITNKTKIFKPTHLGGSAVLYNLLNYDRNGSLALSN